MNQILSAALEEIKFCLFKKTPYYSIRQRIIRGKCKTKAVQADLCIFTHTPTYFHICRHFRHNQAYSGIIQTYPCPFRTLCNPDIFRTLVCLQIQHIQNSSIFRMLTYSSSQIFRILMYWEPCYIHPEPCEISTMEHFRKQLTANIIFAIKPFYVLEFKEKYVNFFNGGRISQF